MRRLRPVLLAAAVVTTVCLGFPQPVLAAVLSYIYSPVAGPPGTAINIEGQCDSASGTASLRFPVRSDALLVIDSKTFTPDGSGHFTVQLNNNISSTQQSPGEDPIDLEVAVVCGNQSLNQPFASTNKSVDAPPTIITGLGAGACGFGFVPEGEDPRIPCPAHVKGTTYAGGINDTNFYALDWRGGVNVAVGDFNNDDQADIIAGSGPGTTSSIAAYNPLGLSFITFNGVYGAFAGGVNVASGDVNGDGQDEIITGAGAGGGPHVLVLTRNAQGGLDTIGSFYAYEPNFHGGVTVAAGDVDGDGKAEIITGAGPGGGPHVRAFKANGATVFGTGFYAYAPNFSGGVNVATGNLVGDDKAEIVTGAGPGGGPHVRTFGGDGSAVGGGFFAYDPAFTGGVSVAVGNADGTVGNEIVTGPYVGGDPHVRAFLNPAGGFNHGGFYAYSKIPAGVRVAVTP